MDREKLTGIGKNLDISKNDINKVRRQYRLVKIFSSIIGIITIVASYIIGGISGGVAADRFMKKYEAEHYPYVAGSLFIFGATIIGSIDNIKSIKMKRDIFIVIIFILTVIFSALAYSSAYDMGNVTSVPAYGVVSRER